MRLITLHSVRDYRNGRRPAHPFLAKMYRCQRRGLFRVTINPATGAPVQAVKLKSTGFGIRDDRLPEAPSAKLPVGIFPFTEAAKMT